MKVSRSNGLLPQKTHVYKNHALDSTIWDGFQPRVGDVIITTALKAGTTWMQAIVGNLIFQGQEMPAPLWQLTPWLDSRGPGSVEDKYAFVEAQTHRRFLKTHLPLTAIPYHPEIKYTYVGRDGRDVFMSLWNHYRRLEQGVIDRFNRTPERAGDPYPACPEDIHEFFRMWISKSWFPWENDGYPFWSLFTHLQSWWDYRHLPNILFLHFNNLLNDLGGKIEIIADYLGIKIDRSFWPTLVDKVSFKGMKADAEEVVPGSGDFLVGGAKRFLYKGTNGRWRGVLTDEELGQYEKAATQCLGPDCKAWLESGL